MNPLGHFWLKMTGAHRLVERVSWLMILLSVSSLSVVRAAESQATGFIRQLHERQLYRLAEVDARRQLAVTDLTDRERAELAGWLLKSIAKQAMESADTSTQPWTAATVAYEAIRRTIDDPYSQAEVDLQFQLVQLWRATARLPAGPFSDDLSASFAEASDSLRSVETSLEDLRERVEQIPRTNTSQKVIDPLAARQLGYLIRFKLGETYERHAQCYEGGTPDRVYLLTQALDHYAAVSRVKPNSELTLESRLQEIACHRQLRNFALARQRLDQFPQQTASPALLSRHVIQEAELRIAQGEPESAARLLEHHRSQPAGQPTWDTQGALQVALVHAYAAASRKTDDESQQTRWQTQALELLNEMEATQSPYWVRKAESWLTTRPHHEQHASDVELLARTAANLFRHGKLDEAHEAFRRASEHAADLGLAERALDLGFQAAAIRHKSGDLNQAAADFLDISERFPNLSRARDAHWLAVILTAQRVREDEALLAQYMNRLVEHAERWPASATSKNARLWHGRVLIQKREYQQAVGTLGSIEPPFDQTKEAFLEIRRAFELWLQTLPEAERRDVASQAVEYFSSQSRATDFGPQKLALSDPAAEAQLAAFWFDLVHHTSTARILEEVTEPEMQDRCERTSPHMTHALLGLAAALQPNVEVASRHWDRVDWREVDDRIALVNRLERASQQSQSPRNLRTRALAAIQLNLIDRIEADSEFESNAAFRQFKAAALTRLGRRDEAISIYSRLASSSPRDPSIQVALAKLRESGEHIDDAQHALAHWRRAARLSPGGSDGWFRAKLGIAQMLVRIGETQRAADAIRIMQALHPSLGGKYKQAFLDLLAKTDEETGSQ